AEGPVNDFGIVGFEAVLGKGRHGGIKTHQLVVSSPRLSRLLEREGNAPLSDRRRKHPSLHRGGRREIPRVRWEKARPFITDSAPGGRRLGEPVAKAVPPA